MTIPKLRAAIIVFLVGFALGVSVFAASRLFVRSILSADAISAAGEVAARLANAEGVEAVGTLSSVLRYTYFGADGTIVESRALAPQARPASSFSGAEIQRISQLAAEGGAIVAHAPLLPSLFGLSESAVRGVAVPVVSGGRMLGSVLVEVDQTLALQSLTRAFSLVGMVTVGLAVLAVIAIAFAVTRGRGFSSERKAFDPNLLPRDPLTNVPTRRGFKEALQDAVERAQAADQQVGLLVVDLDAFRAVNDVWGHAAGDEVLGLVAERLRAFASGPAGVARIDGDEFALIVEGEATHAMRQLVDKIRAALVKPFVVAGSSITLTASIGAALYPVNAESADILFRAADTALSKAKTQGRNALAFFDTEMKERMRKNAALERDLKLAIEREEFVVFYQPQLELASGRLRGYEALVRWERPGEGILAPQDFLAVAEETGLIRPIGEWVLRKACADAATWLDSGTVAVNFCAAQFQFQDLEETIAKTLKETGLPAERLEIEIPENLFLADTPDVMHTLSRIKALGVRVAMDDFGGGYSGLASLAHFPFDKVKIDRSFVSQLTEDADVAAIVASIVGLGRSLSVDITAEGVETREQVTLLRAAGCNIVQGFLFGAPKRESSLPEDADDHGGGEPGARAASGVAT
jgi:diguanylate cyclase (GGDEF)-like protein